MPKLNFTKMVAAGNDFVVIKADAKLQNLSHLARRVCERKFGIGADGLLVLGKSKAGDIRMRIFNADGSEAEMCGNGARCAAFFAGRKNVCLETKAGLIQARVNKDRVRIRLTGPKAIKLDMPIKINNRNLKVNFINTGVPHAVIFVEGLDEMHIADLGRAIRYHRRFAPAGTNVNFSEFLGKNYISVRTYERGVEDETLACGTGSVAAALLTAYSLKLTTYHFFNVMTKSGEVLKVYFTMRNNKFSDVWLEGKAKIAYKGVYNV